VKDTRCNLCGSDRQATRYDFKTFKVVRCRGCGLLSVRVPHERFDPASLYDEHYYKEREDYYFYNPITNPRAGYENQNILDFRRGLALLEEHKNPGGSKLLDVGCALGIFLCMAKERGWDTYGVDISEYATRYARETFGITTMCGLLPDLKLPEKEFDAITLWDVFEHFADPVAQMREIHRILKDDGVVLLDTPNADALIRRVAHAIYWATRGKVSYPAQKLHHIFHLYYYSRETATRLLEQSGFKIVWTKGKPIPLVKARGTPLERLVVKAFSVVEARLDMQYEILMLLKKAL